MIIRILIIQLFYFILIGCATAGQVKVMGNTRMIEDSEIEEILLEVCSDLVEELNGDDELRIKEHKYFIQLKSPILDNNILNRILAKRINWLAWDEGYEKGQETIQVLKEKKATLISVEISLEDLQTPLIIIQWIETELAGGGLVYVYEYKKDKDIWNLKDKQIGYSI